MLRQCSRHCVLRHTARRLSSFTKTTAGYADIRIATIGLFSSDARLLRARIFDTPTGQALLDSCPHEMSLQTYGAEVYGPLKAPLPSFQLQPMIPPGGLAYSAQGNYLCVFWGQAPAWPVDYIGQIDEWESLKGGPWNELRMVRAAPEEAA